MHECMIYEYQPLTASPELRSRWVRNVSTSYLESQSGKVQQYDTVEDIDTISHYSHHASYYCFEIAFLFS